MPTGGLKDLRMDCAFRRNDIVSTGMPSQPLPGWRESKMVSWGWPFAGAGCPTREGVGMLAVCLVPVVADVGTRLPTPPASDEADELWVTTGDRL